MKKPSKIIHLLKPKEYRVWCRPKVVPGNFSVTTEASKATCAVCLSAMRFKLQGIHRAFKVSHTGRDYNEHEV